MWIRLPTSVRAIATGITVAAIGTMPWAWLVSANITHGSALPWSVPIMAVCLLAYWGYFVRGWGWPRSTAETRRVNSRANRLPGEVWAAALLAGMLGLVSVLLFQGIWGRLVVRPKQRDIDVTQYPVVTVL